MLLVMLRDVRDKREREREKYETFDVQHGGMRVVADHVVRDVERR